MTQVPVNGVPLLLKLFALVVVAGAEKGFLKGTRRAHHKNTATDFRMAMGTVMGCGGSGASQQLAAVEKSVMPMWKVLPRNQHGLVDWNMVRYVAHRYFVQRSNFLIRGFEPMKHVDMSDMGAANILNQHGLSNVSHSANGFSFTDTVTIIATLEQIIEDADHTALQQVYNEMELEMGKDLDRVELRKVARYFMMRWILGEQIVGKEAQGMLFMEKTFHGWQNVKDYIDGEIRGLAFAQYHSPKMGHLNERYSFEEVFQILSKITRTFASYWESECHHTHDSLVSMDMTGTGRVSLSDFYAAHAGGEWRFAESEAYLRELGALDETSVLRGKQVMIANYVQGANNCIVSTDQYMVCCTQQCEEVMNQIEDSVGSPLATPAEVVDSIVNTSGFNDEVPLVSSRLRNQLAKVAENYGGRVPLHGRLFAQWLHYVLPRQCPFPHKKGVVSSATPAQFGENYVVSESDARAHASTANAWVDKLHAQQEEAQAMSQWSEEEELLVDYSSHVGGSWGLRKFFMYACVAALLFMAAGATVKGGKGRPASDTILHFHQPKSHLV